MNPHFSRERPERDFPRRGYGKLEQIEPFGPRDDEDIFVAFDVVDAKWTGFGKGLLALDGGPLEALIRIDYWAWLFRRRREKVPPDYTVNPFDGLPLFRVEFTLPAKHPWRSVLNLNEEAWFDLELGSSGEVEAEVYAGFFSPVQVAYLVKPPTISPASPALSRVFDESLWPDATAAEIRSALSGSGVVEALVGHDVGQGSAVALMGSGGAHYYFDVGCGIYANKGTCPVGLQFCDCASPPIILSHWDKDHWAGATVDTSLLGRTWIVPRQFGLPAGHIVFANDILAAGGSILVFPKALSPLSWTNGTETFELSSCTGRSRNGSGLAMTVTDNQTGLSWMLTGDAGYKEISVAFPSNLVGITVPHHGADMTKLGSAPAPATQSYRRAVYSFGPGNVNGKTKVQHPVAASVADHKAAGWDPGSWAGAPTPATAVPVADTLATATHAVTHDGSLAVGFVAPPALPLPHEPHCRKPMSIRQT